MDEVAKERAVAEKYLDEMLEADSTDDYGKFIQRFDKNVLSEFTSDIFHTHVKHMRDELGQYKRRTYLGHLHRFRSADQMEGLRFVWRAEYEKNEALLVVGIHQTDGVWWVHENTVTT